jgi:hypothetical protein
MQGEGESGEEGAHGTGRDRSDPCVIRAVPAPKHWLSFRLFDGGGGTEKRRSQPAGASAGALRPAEDASRARRTPIVTWCSMPALFSRSFVACAAGRGNQQLLSARDRRQLGDVAVDRGTENAKPQRRQWTHDCPVVTFVLSCVPPRLRPPYQRFRRVCPPAARCSSLFLSLWGLHSDWRTTSGEITGWGHTRGEAGGERQQGTSHERVYILSFILCCRLAEVRSAELKITGPRGDGRRTRPDEKKRTQNLPDGQGQWCHSTAAVRLGLVAGVDSPRWPSLLHLPSPPAAANGLSAPDASVANWPSSRTTGRRGKASEREETNRIERTGTTFNGGTVVAHTCILSPTC